LKLATLNSTQYRNVYDISNDSLCPKKGKYHDIKCLSHKCQKCGVEKLRKKLPTIQKENITWERWENRRIEHSKGVKIKNQLQSNLL
jgi:hypothetical protein